MGIDVTQWRVRIGTFCQSARLKSFLPVLEIGKITIAIRIVLFLLLVLHGVESNPGPSDVGERSCSKMRQCRGLGVDKEFRKASDDGRLLIDEANIHKTAKIRSMTGLLQNNSVSHELSTIKPKSQSQHNSQLHSQPQTLNLRDQQNRTKSLSQPQSHSQPLYLPDPQKRPESESLSQLQSHSQPIYSPEDQNLPESLAKFQSHSQPQYLPDPQKRSETLSQLQSHSQPLYLSDPQMRSESESLSQLQSHSQPLLCQYQLQSQSICTCQESIMNICNSSISSVLQQINERFDILNRRIEDLETFKERVTKADKGTDSIRDDWTGRQEKNPKRTTEKANAADDYVSTNPGVRHLGKDDISQDLSSRPPVDDEGEREGRTEPNNCSLSDNREEDDDTDEYSSDEVVNSIADKMLSSDNMYICFSFKRNHFGVRRITPGRRPQRSHRQRPEVNYAEDRWSTHKCYQNYTDEESYKRDGH